MKVKVKICGIKTLEAAQAALSAGADFLGFNFVEPSKRYIKPEEAKKIIKRLEDEYFCHCEERSDEAIFINRDRHAPIRSGLAMTVGDIKIIGVFQDEKLEIVNRLVEYLKPDFVQLHGNESPEYVDAINNAGIIKTLSLDSDFDVYKTVERMKKYAVDYFLLDRKEQGRGELLNYDKVQKLTSIFSIILAGGLTVEDVSEAVKSAKPKIVDVAGGVETNGEKDSQKIIKFIKKAKQYDI